jgi:hypothetical protein
VLRHRLHPELHRWVVLTHHGATPLQPVSPSDVRTLLHQSFTPSDIPSLRPSTHVDVSCVWCAVTAILESQEGHPGVVLAQAAKFLIHYIGDIHQPLHVGYKQDKGGASLLRRVLAFGLAVPCYS